MKYIAIFLIFFISSCCPHKFIPDGEYHPNPPFYVPEKIRVALVLGSGGVRGMAHVGVMEELLEAGIDFDLIVGCSAGSLVGALYADSLDICKVKNAVYQMRTQSILDINIWNARFGLSQGGALLKIMDRYLDAETFDQLKMPFVAVAVDLHTAELVPIGCGDIVRAVRASTSIPFVFVPVELNGRILVDGGVINPVPVCVAKDLGAELVIAVDLCELLETTFPTNLFQVTTRSAEIAFLWQNSTCVHHADVIIRPRMCGVGTFNDEMKNQLYWAGREAAREALPKIYEYLSQLPPKKCNEGYQLVHLDCYGPVEKPYDFSY